nr:Chain B, 30S ribosomal protein S2 [Escherichia coli K-12]7OXI_C Chain C, 30S ribosomal protein S2 [Escherichia coli K-12]
TRYANAKMLPFAFGA